MSISVFAPASIGNIGIGFDIMGMAIERPGDEVVARLSDTPGLRITRITGMSGQLPYDVHKNTAGVAYVAGRAAGSVGSAGGAAANGARAAYQRVAQRGGVST